ncbi:MAG: ABC transporter ATP-binding protein [Chloroflexota bacterium]
MTALGPSRPAAAVAAVPRRPPGLSPGVSAAAFGSPGQGAAVAATPAVRIVGASARYRGREVLRDIDLSIAPGERLAVVGPNGAGKSTLLRLIAGVLAPASGSVEIGGDSLARLDRIAIARRIAAVPQQVALPFAMTVEEVVALGRLPHEDPFRGPREVDRAAVVAAIERVGLGHLVGRDAREISLGERQLVLLALSVAQATPILLLDEPTVHLDLRHQVEAMELLVDLNERDGTTIVAVLHDLALAAHFFPRLVLVADGTVVADGAPGSVLVPEAIRSVFGVDPVHALRAGRV